MNIEKSFSNFYSSIHLDSTADYDSAIKSITKKLNDYYYEEDDCSDLEIDHCSIVGSIGRGTAIKNASDVDILFELPNDVYERFNAYTSNGQSALLQEIKKIVLERYPKTDVKGDGQAVVIEFTSFSIDLVPAFRNLDGSFMCPDSNNGGSWKNTNPFPEQNASKHINDVSKNNFVQLANMMRAWKDNSGFIFGGLLIDTLVNDFLVSNPSYYYKSFDSYITVLNDLLKYLSDRDSSSIVYALGSYQIVNDKGNGKYISEAKDMYDALQKADEDYKIENVFVAMFGGKFKDSMVDSMGKRILEDAYRQFSCNNTEQYIEDLFPVNIRHSLTIDCRVSMNGWRTFLLRKMIALSLQRHLEFFIQSTTVPKPYSVYWKVRNVGTEAYRRNCIRGQIVSGGETKKETSNFDGPHYVECYIVKGGVCVARNRINVNINSKYDDKLDI